jgi:hypothetical protein
MLSGATQITGQQLTDAGADAHAIAAEMIAAAAGAADEIRARAQRDADEIRARAQRDAEDLIAAAHMRIRQEQMTAEGRAAERLDAAEHEALAIRRNAWKLSRTDLEPLARSLQAFIDLVASGADPASS